MFPVMLVSFLVLQHAAAAPAPLLNAQMRLSEDVFLNITIFNIAPINENADRNGTEDFRPFVDDKVNGSNPPHVLEISRDGGCNCNDTQTTPPPQPPTLPPPPTQPLPPPPTKEDLCKDAWVDAMLRINDTKLIKNDIVYAFRGHYCYKLQKNRIDPAYPKLIADTWRDLPGDIDAAFTYGGKTFFFKGSQFWRYVGNNMDGDFPKPISGTFQGIPDNIDAAVVWTGDEKIYFFKGSSYWKFGLEEWVSGEVAHPKPISDWRGIPDDLDAATVENGLTFFFKGNIYWRINDKTMAVDGPSYPLSTGRNWFGCS